MPSNNKQLFHVLLFIIRNYSSEAINIQRREVELNITLPRVNNFDIKQKKAWKICFIVCHQYQTRSGKIKTNKRQQVSFKTQIFFCKNWTTTYLKVHESRFENLPIFSSSYENNTLKISYWNTFYFFRNAHVRYVKSLFTNVLKVLKISLLFKKFTNVTDK